MEQTKQQQVWLVTGASKGLGLALVQFLLQQGMQVAATSRSKEELEKAVGGNNSAFLPLQVNLADETSVAAGIQAIITTFGRLDVVVNNAGYGIGGSVEELSDEATRQAFDVNVFGMLNVIRQAMPQLRAQQRGHIINISSIAGFAPATGWSIYAATKYAVTGMSEVLAEDVRPFGINVTVVSPGAFRTNFLTGESLVLTSTPIEAYSAVRSSHQRYLEMNGTQVGDPVKAARAIYALTLEAHPPVQLLLGSDAYRRAFQKLDVLSTTFNEQEALTKSTDY